MMGFAHMSAEGWVIFFLVFGFPIISAGSLLAFWLYEEHRQTLHSIRTVILGIFTVFVIGYALSTVGSITLLFEIYLYLSAGLLAVLVNLSIGENKYPKVLIGVGWAIIFISLISFFFTVSFTLSVNEAFLSGELEMSTKFEAFYKYFLPWFFRTLALLTYGAFTATIGYVLREGALDKFHNLLKIEAGIFMFFISSEIIHSFIFGRMIGI